MYFMFIASYLVFSKNEQLSNVILTSIKNFGVKSNIKSELFWNTEFLNFIVAEVLN